MGAVDTANDATSLIVERRMRCPKYKPNPNKGFAHPLVRFFGIWTIQNGVYDHIEPTALYLPIALLVPGLDRIDTCRDQLSTTLRFLARLGEADGRVRAQASVARLPPHREAEDPRLPPGATRR
jgi:hypothetical protein